MASKRESNNKLEISIVEIRLEPKIIRIKTYRFHEGLWGEAVPWNLWKQEKNFKDVKIFRMVKRVGHNRNENQYTLQ